ncbi:putative O-fucosyltransferase-like protein [Favolaschia claudopus]|uniref:O-fucosyltransferase-like protein n=1 Tax=Favolaschia claudopus TaxID=2862362 RepID=A0AAW0A9F4_9AGAR
MSMATTKLPGPLQSKHWLIALAAVQAVVCIFILQTRFWDTSSLPHSSCAAVLVESSGPEPVTVAVSSPEPKPKDNALLVYKNATTLFRDNLQKDVKYITSWPVNGWPNQVIQYMNLLYLARLTERVPILPRFRPIYLKGKVSALDFSDVFDLARLRKELKTPILEWRDVKDPESKAIETVGCWDIHDKSWETDSYFLQPPVDLNLDISYTSIPPWVRDSLEMDQKDRSMYLWPLASLISFSKRVTTMRALATPSPSPLHQKIQAPDDQLFCSNHLSFDFSLRLLEVRQDISPAWQAVGRHMHLTPAVQEVAAQSTRQTLGLASTAHIPPYIAVHIRRGDFAKRCKLAGVSPSECLAPFSAYVRRVKEVRAEILEDTGVAVDRVIVTSDEVDEAWWEPVHKVGWLRPNHTETLAVHGSWYPMFIDAAIHGAAYGFVGTDSSTGSILARRRVSSRGGVTEMVKWGKPHADAH